MAFKLTTKYTGEKEATNFIQTSSRRKPGVLTKKITPSSKVVPIL